MKKIIKINKKILKMRTRFYKSFYIVSISFKSKILLVFPLKLKKHLLSVLRWGDDLLNKEKIKENWHTPSSTNSKLLLIVFLSLTFLLLRYNNSEENSSNFYTVHCGLSAIIIALIIFATQQLRNSNTHWKGLVLIRTGFVFPLLEVQLILFFIFTVFKNNSIHTVLFIINLFLIFLSFYKILSTIINERKLNEIYLKMLIVRFNDCVEDEQSKYEENKKIYKLLKENKKIIKYNSINANDNNEYKVWADKNGIVEKINLEEIINIIKKEQNRLKIETKSDNSLKIATEIEKIKVSFTAATLGVTIKDKVSEGKNVLFSIRKENIKEEEFKVLKAIKDCFKINDKELPFKQLEWEFKTLKDRFIEAINNQKDGEIENLTKYYIEILREYLIILSEIGVKNEDDFNIASEWLINDLRDIIIRANQTRNIEIIRKIFRISVQISLLSLEYNNRLLFYDSISLITPIYYYSVEYNFKSEKREYQQLHNKIVDWIWHKLKDIINIYTSSLLKEKIKHKEEYNDELCKYGVHILKTFQNLINKAYDEDDYKAFCIFVEKVNDLFKYWQNDAVAEMRVKREEMLFGLTSWIFYDYRYNSNDGIYYSTLSGFSKVDKFKKLTESLFSEIHINDKERYWGWHWWDRKAGEAGSRKMFQKPDEYYCIKALLVLRDESADCLSEIAKKEIAINCDSLCAILDEVLGEVEKNKRLKEVLSEDAVKKIPQLKEIFKNAKNDIDKKEKKTVRSLTISNLRIEQFKKGFQEKYNDSAKIREILKLYDLYKNKIPEIHTSKPVSCGKELLEKEYFLEEYNSPCEERGNDFGNKIAQEENTIIVNEIYGNKCKKKDLSEIESIVAKNPENYILILINNGIHGFFGLESTQYIIEDERIKTKAYAGLFKCNKYELPVFEVYDEKIKSRILLLNTKKLGILKQYGIKDKELNVGFFHVNIEQYNAKIPFWKNILKNPPDWLEQKGDPKKQEEFLQEHVSIDCLENINFEFNEDFEGYIINPPPPTAESIMAQGNIRNLK